MPRDWNESYLNCDLPWDTGTPSVHLIRAFEAETFTPCRALEIGCGSGTNTIWLAEHGFDTVGIDISPRAVEIARAKADDARADCRLEVLDFLADDPPGGPFDFVFDRGVFHTFDDDDTRARFAKRVAAALTADGQWMSIIGSTEGPPRDHGPPRRTAREVLDAVEPSLELVSLTSARFEEAHEFQAMAWVCLSRRRKVPAQRSSRH